MEVTASQGRSVARLANAGTGILDDRDARGRMSVPGPGRVKTQSVLWFPLLNRGGMMRGFVQEADRQQTTLLPECLDDWVGESNPVRVVDVFVDALELRDLGFDGVDPAATGRPARVPSFADAQALHLRLSQP